MGSRRNECVSDLLNLILKERIKVRKTLVYFLYNSNKKNFLVFLENDLKKISPLGVLPTKELFQYLSEFNENFFFERSCKYLPLLKIPKKKMFIEVIGTYSRMPKACFGPHEPLGVMKKKTVCHYVGFELNFDYSTSFEVNVRLKF